MPPKAQWWADQLHNINQPSQLSQQQEYLESENSSIAFAID